jgi:phosphatidyl-myo-inositol dimannoside synthase
MKLFDIKNIVDPFIHLSIILLIIFLANPGNSIILPLTFTLFLFISLTINLILIIKKIIKVNYYFFVYGELFFSLIFLIPLYYYLGLKNYILISLATIGLVDFVIQAIYNIYPRHNCNFLLKKWNKNLLKIEREIFHPISLPLFRFKDFTLRILDIEKLNLTRNHVLHNFFLKLNLNKSLVKHQFGGKNTIVFFLYLNHKLNSGYENLNGVLQDKCLIQNLKKINNNIAKYIRTAYVSRNGSIKICMDKSYVMKNPEKVYDFLKKAKSEFDTKGKLLILVTHFPPHIGGSCTLFYNICKNMDPNKFIVLTHNEKDANEFDKQQKFKTYRTERLIYHENKSVLIDLITYYKSYKCIKKLIKEENIKVVLSDNFANTFPLPFLKIPFYTYCHGEEINSERGRLSEYIKSFILPKAKGLIAVSDYTSKLISKYNKNIKTIYNAVELNKFYPSTISSKLKHDTKDITLLTVGRLEKRKNHEAVIRLMPKLIKINPSLKYIIIGNGSIKQHLVNLAKDLKNNVLFIDNISNNELIDYYNLADIFVMPNITLKDGDTEGFGIVFLEANACGKPVIGGKYGGVTSAIKEGYNGYLVKDDKELYNKLSLLITNASLRTKMSKNAIKWSSQFTYEKIVKQLKEFIRF